MKRTDRQADYIHAFFFRLDNHTALRFWVILKNLYYLGLVYMDFPFKIQNIFFIYMNVWFLGTYSTHGCLLIVFIHFIFYFFYIFVFVFSFQDHLLNLKLWFSFVFVYWLNIVFVTSLKSLRKIIKNGINIVSTLMKSCISLFRNTWNMHNSSKSKMSGL